MGSVYLAEHPLIGKKVALKVIHRELAGNKEVIQRFFNEARAVNKIGNEHIVEIHDFGQSDEGEHFFIMEYLQGRTLAHVLETEGVLAALRGLHIAAQIANGLAAAHSCGIIHRDLKPDNIMLLDRLGDRDFVKVLDFGLAKMIHDTASAKLTAAGVVLGTPQYMSPEACESKPGIDHRSDIYCLGILMFQMLTGRVPFEGQSMGEILVKHVSQSPPAPRGLNPNIPPAVEQIILRCLAKQPDHRFATMKDLRDALLDADKYLASSPPVMPTSPVQAAPEDKTMFPGAMHAPVVAAAAAGPAADPRLALRAPPSQVVSTAAASAKTAFLEAQPAPVVAPGNAAASAKTAFLDGPVTAGGGAAAGDPAKTAFMDAAAPVPAQAPEMPKRSTTAVPDMNMPAPTHNMTMVIGTPEGYSDKPPAKTWPIVVALLAVLGVVAFGVTALVWPGFLNSGGDKTASAAPAGGATDSGDKRAEPAPGEREVETPADTTAEETPGADDVADDTPPAPPEPAKVTITVRTKPEGAEVWSNGELLGTTPADLQFDKDSEHELVFKHPDMRDRTESLVASANTEMSLRLKPKARTSSTKSSSSSGTRKTGGKTGKSGGKATDDTVAPDFGP